MTSLEDLFDHLVSRLSSRPLPDSLRPLLKAKRSEHGRRWMRRHGVEEESLMASGYGMLLWSLLASLAGILLAALLFGLGAAPLALFPAALAPLIASSLLVNAPEMLARDEERRMLQESPVIVAYLTMSLQLQPSLERAALFAAKRGQGVMARRIREAVWSTLTRTSRSIEEALLDLASALSPMNDPLRQSLHLMMSSTCERTKEGMERLLDKANTVALGGIRDAVDRYVSTLSVPTMILFSLGTLLPIMLFTLLPLLSISSAVGSAGGPAPAFDGLTALLLAIVPVAALGYSWAILARSPLRSPPSPRLVWRSDVFMLTAGWGVVVAASLLTPLGDLRPYVVISAAVLPPCSYLALTLRAGHRTMVVDKGREKDFIGALYQIGNMMAAGAGLEQAMRSAARNRTGSPFDSAARRVLHRAAVSGKGVREAIEEDGAFSRASPMVEAAYLTVADCAVRDPCYAGQVGLNLAQLLTDLGACRSKVEEKLRSVVDMMRSTSLVFGPVVLGVTSSLFALMGGADPMASVVLTTGAYIVELAFIVSYFTVSLMGEGSWSEIVYQFATRAPVALMVFSATSIICRTGLSSLL